MSELTNITIDRRKLVIKPNTIVSYKHKQYKISNILNSNEVIISEINGIKAIQVEIAELQPVVSIEESLNFADVEVSDKDWNEALKRYELIKPLIDSSSVKQVTALALENNVHETTIWKWLKLYRTHKSIMALIPQKRGWKNQNKRLSEEVEKIISLVIQEKYLNSQKLSISKTIEFIKAECYRQHVQAPHANTIRRRIEALSEFQKVKHREGKKAAKDKFAAAAGEFPNADYPLAYVQIDHTPLDIEIVDEEYRETIGRPFLTLAIDVFSRMIVGYYLSLDSPSATSVGMCITSGILSKRKKLQELDIDAEWNVEGLMDCIHTDNGSDFRSHYLQRACIKYGINWEYRPIGGARFGGHIERMLGIVNLEMHILDGTTFENTTKRENYNSAEKACMTLRELEYYTVYWITKVYHLRKHSTLEIPPIQKWEEGIWGTPLNAGTGLKDRVADEHTLYLDFLPEFEATIQRHGVQKDKIFYFADCLRPWINATEGNVADKKIKKKFIFKRDPRDISSIWFFEPKSRSYFKVKTSKREIPSFSLSEYKSIKKYLKSKCLESNYQDEIYKAILHLQEQVDHSRSLTRKQRRINQKRKENKRNIPQSSNSTDQIGKTQLSNEVDSDSLWNQSITAFSEIR